MKTVYYELQITIMLFFFDIKESFYYLFCFLGSLSYVKWDGEEYWLVEDEHIGCIHTTANSSVPCSSTNAPPLHPPTGLHSH